MAKRPRPEDLRAAMRFMASLSASGVELRFEDTVCMERARELARRYLQFEFDFMLGDERK